MKKLFTILTTLALLCAVGCEEQGDDNVNPNDKPNTEQPGEKPDDGSGDTEKPEDQTPDDKPSVSDTPLADIPCAPNEILYTTKYDLPIELGNTQGFGGNLVYNTYENGIGKLTFGNDVTAIPASAFKDCNSMEYIKLPDGISSVSRTAFRGCTSLVGFCGKSASEDGKCLIFDNKLVAFAPGLTEYIIPDSVTSIEECAFCECSRLVSIIIPDKVTEIGYCAFSDCTSLTNVVIGEGVTKIDAGAFQNCTSLAKINIPNSVTSIGMYAFLYCTGELTIDNKWLIENNTKLAQTSSFDRVNFSSIVIGENITKIGNDVFSGFSSLTGVTIPDSVTRIGERAFSDCTSLTSVHITDIAAWCGIGFSDNAANPLYYAHNLYLNGELVTNLVIPDSVTLIRSYTFSGCSSLTSVTIANGVTEIGWSAFAGCTSLTSVTIPNSVTQIREGAFFGCTSLTSVHITDIAAWCGINFYNYTANPLGYAHNLYLNGELVTNLVIPDSVTSIRSYTFSGCSSLTSITIPDSVTSIGGGAFMECTSLTSINIPDSVTSIAGGAFMECTSLKSVTIGDGVTWIGNKAFFDCTSLASITIPDSVTSIGYAAFSDCTSLTRVYCKPTAPPTGDYDMFYYNASGRKIYVPRDSVDAYKKAYYWNSYADSIEGYDFE